MPNNHIFNFEGISAKRGEQLEKIISYVDRIRENGEIDLFSIFFQTDYRILLYLRSNPGAHPSALADSLKVSRPNIAAALRILESKDYILRKIDADNRRQFLVFLTPKGLRYIEIVGKKLLSLINSWLSILGNDEVSHLIKILEISSDPKLMTDDLKRFSFDD